MKQTACIMSFDAGTSGIKAVLVGVDGTIRASANAGYALLRPQEGWAEQVPSEYWTAACCAARSVMEKSGAAPQDVLGVVFATQWKGMIPLDEAGNVLHNSIIWMDTRAEEEAAQLAAVSGRACVARDYWPRIVWFKKHYPELYGKTVCFLEANGYLKYRATGEKAIDQGEHFTRSPIPRVQELFDAMLTAGELDADLFPPVVNSTDEVGRMTEEAVTIGAGASAVGGAHIYLGTSGWVGLTRAVGDGKPRIPMVVAEDRWVHTAGMQAACMSYDWCLRTFYCAELAQLGDGIFDFVEKELSQIPAGSLGLTALPSLNGEGGPFSPTMRAGFTNVKAIHDRRHMVNAVLEGICCILRLRKEMIEKDSGQIITHINAVGGGAGSDHWMQMMADVLQVEICVPDNARYSGALGAAYCAMIGLGLCRDFDECAEKVRIAKRFLPKAENKEVYEEKWERFKKTADALGQI